MGRSLGWIPVPAPHQVRAQTHKSLPFSCAWAGLSHLCKSSLWPPVLDDLGGWDSTRGQAAFVPLPSLGRACTGTIPIFIRVCQQAHVT